MKSLRRRWRWRRWRRRLAAVAGAVAAAGRREAETSGFQHTERGHVGQKPIVNLVDVRKTYVMGHDTGGGGFSAAVPGRAPP